MRDRQTVNSFHHQSVLSPPFALHTPCYMLHLLQEMSCYVWVLCLYLLNECKYWSGVGIECNPPFTLKRQVCFALHFTKYSIAPFIQLLWDLVEFGWAEDSVSWTCSSREKKNTKNRKTNHVNLSYTRPLDFFFLCVCSLDLIVILWCRLITWWVGSWWRWTWGEGAGTSWGFGWNAG